MDWFEGGCPQPSQAHRAAAEARQKVLTKPPGSLGVLETLAIRLAELQATDRPRAARAPIVLFAGDHGITAQGISAYPPDVTVQMLHNFAAGGAAIAVLARELGAKLHVVDAGTLAEDDIPGVTTDKPRRGTRDFSCEAAMTHEELVFALSAGRRAVERARSGGADIIILGEMGIGNTTSAAALIAAFTGRDAADVTGRGTGIDDAMLGRKIEIVAAAVAAAAPNVESLALLSRLGGLEIAALAGYIVEACTARVPLVVDGVIACAAALVADAIAPGVRDLVIAGHRSTEPGASIALAHLGLEPLVDLELRLGEGTGAALAIPLVQTAARLLTEMATLDDL